MIPWSYIVRGLLTASTASTIARNLKTIASPASSRIGPHRAKSTGKRANICLELLYRNTSGYQRRLRVILTNRQRYSASFITKSLGQAGGFVPADYQLPSVSPFDPERAGNTSYPHHPYHTVSQVYATDQPSTMDLDVAEIIHKTNRQP